MGIMVSEVYEAKVCRGTLATLLGRLSGMAG